MTGVIRNLRKSLLVQEAKGMTDGQLLESFVGRREKAALEVLVHRHAAMVWGVCRRLLRHEQDAEDAFQATFLVLVRKAASVKPRELVGNWLYGVARQTGLNLRAALGKRRTRETQLANIPEKAVNEQRTWKDLDGILDQELGRLGDNYRALIVLCDLLGKTRKEAAQQLGLPEGTIASRLARARVLLAKRLTKRGVALSGGALAATLAENAASAAVPAAVVSSTINAACCFAAGQMTATGPVSVKVAALVEGVLKAMMISKLKAVVAVLLVLGFLVTGASVLTHRTAAQPSATPAPPVAAAQDAKSILEGSKAGDRKELAPGIAFRWCPPGNFRMGEGGETIDVELSKGFWLGETEITQGQWQKLMGTSPWSGRTGVGARASTDTTAPKEGPDYAASYISHDDALSFCNKLTTQEQVAGRLPKSWKYSLPTEAQWEYACRAGTRTKFSFGEGESQLSQFAWFGDHSGKEPYARQVGLKKPNAWGLRDMHGNVWEWCSDWYGDKRSGGKDPVGPTTPPPQAGGKAPVGPATPPPPEGSSGRNRVVRGGDWLGPALDCSSANRFYCNPHRGNSVQGFRLAAVPAGQHDKKRAAEKSVGPTAKQAKDTEAFTAWGKEINGLQAGIGFRPREKRAYSHGETVKLVVRVRNAGKEEVNFQYVPAFFKENPPTVIDAAGQPVPLRAFLGTEIMHPSADVTLAPGKEVELYEWKAALRPARDSKNPNFEFIYGTGKFSIQYERVLGNSTVSAIEIDPALSKIATGKLELEVKEPEKQPQEDKKETFTSWGKEIGGLQAGIGFRPGEKRAYHHGESVTIVARIRNLSKEAIEFKHIWAFFVENAPTVTDPRGKVVQLPRVGAEGLQMPRSTKVPPGKDVDLYEWNFDLDNGWAKYHGTGTFTLQCKRFVGPTSANPNHPNPALDKLATGKLEVEIKAAPPPADAKPAAAVPALQGPNAPTIPLSTRLEDKKVKFVFRDKPWREVLEWLADQTGLPVVTNIKPEGTFSYNPPKGGATQKTIPEVIAILNESLRQKHLVLVRREATFTLIAFDQHANPLRNPDPPARRKLENDKRDPAVKREPLPKPEVHPRPVDPNTAGAKRNAAGDGGARSKPIRMRVWIEKVNADSRTITASCMTIGQIDNAFKPLRFENLAVSEKARIQDDGRELPLTDLAPGTGVFLELEARALAFVVVGIEIIVKTPRGADSQRKIEGNKR
jgi:RNA polymerase sigma factor (sigma-70 family)